jgi:hypothetical protein
MRFVDSFDLGSRTRFAVTLGLALALAACPSEPEVEKLQEEPAELPEGEAPIEPVAIAEDATDLSELYPIISPIPEASVAPDRIAIQLYRPVVDREGVPADDRTRFELDPPVRGTLRFSGRSTLEFLPSSPFAPGTKYVAKLTSLQIGADGRATGSVVRAFETPPFAFVRADLLGFHPEKSRAELELVYAAAVRPKEVAARAELRVAGQVMKKVRFERTDRPSVVRVTIQDPIVERAKSIQIAIAQGVPSVSGDAEAPPSEAEVRLVTGPPITIHAAHAREGAGGFYVQVVCSDAASSKETMYFWDEVARTSYELSQRCVLDEEDAKRSIHIEPKVDAMISPMRGGFRILAPFERGSYTVSIDAGARSVDGGVTSTAFVRNLSVPARTPAVSFVSQGRYLPRSAWRTLAIRHLNLPSAKLEVRHIRPDNMVFWLGANEETADHRNSDLILTEEIDLAGEPDAMTTSWIDVGTIVGRAPAGVLELSLSGNGAGRTSRARLLLTDLNLIAKKEEGTGKVRVFALGIHDNAPEAGVEITSVVPSGRAVSACSTAWDGSCELAPPDPRTVDKTEPFAVIARKGDDVTYLAYEEVRTPLEEASVRGRPYSAKTPYTAAIWTDRGVYRPGETARFGVIVRGADSLAPSPAIPVVFELEDPRRKVMKRTVEDTNVAGMIAFDVPFADFATTGRYRLRASAGKEAIGEHVFSVEEFVPERMRVRAEVKPSELSFEDDARVAVEASYLFGGSAEDSPFEVACDLVPETFRPARNDRYEYGVFREGPAKAIPLGKATGILSEGGLGEVSCPSLGGRGRIGGTARVVADVAVFESSSGRTTRGGASALVHPERFYLGLRSTASEVKSGESFSVQGIVVDWKGDQVRSVSKVALSLHRVEREHDWVYDDADGQWSHREHRRLVLETEVEVRVEDGAFAHAFHVAEDGGGFVVRARAERARTDLYLDGSGSFDWYGDEYGEDKTPRPMKPASVEISAPPEMRVGEKTRVTFVSPFRGRALVGVETDRILEKKWIDVEAAEATFDVEIERFVPNVYVTVLIAKDPHASSEQAFIPERAFGARSIRVSPEAYERGVQIHVPEEIRSGSKLAVDLDFGGIDEQMFATVAVVDEGILSLTKFESPNPFDAIFDPRALGVATHETIGWNLLLPAAGPSGASGGDAAGDGGRIQPVRPVALWSGLIEVPESGKVTVPFDVPQYRGALRVMVVAAGKKRMSHGSAQVLVRDPLVVQATLPRFLTAGDRVDVPVFVTNVSGRKEEVTVGVKVEGLDGAVDPIRLKESSKKQAIEDGDSKTFVFGLSVIAQTGGARLSVVAEGGGHRSTESLEVPLLPSGPRVRLVKRIPLPPGRTDVTKELDGWLRTTERSTFWVTANPYGSSFDHLHHLLRYPYGCIEQTTSSTRPLLYAGKLVPSVDPKLTMGTSLDALVMSGVNRILSMQAPAGGFAYWPGGTEPAWWGTAYATHFLLDAKNLGHPVPEARIEDALDWIERALDSEVSVRNTDQWYARPYMHYVLSLAGRGRKAEMVEIVEKRAAEKLDGEGREAVFLLKAGLYAMGDRRYEEDLRKPSMGAIAADRKNSWSFYSDLRARGLMLSVFVDLFQKDPAGERLATLVAESLQAHRSSWYTTQELVWAVTGLGKWIGDVATEHSPGVLLVDGKEVEPSVLGTSKDRTFEVNRASEKKRVEVRVDQANVPLYLVLSSEGVRENGKWEIGGEGLLLSRELRRPNGESIELRDGVRLGDVIYAVLTIRNTTGSRIQNIALVDRFPGGWEIENARLGRGGTIDWIDANALWSTDHMNLRDDRVEVFGPLGAKDERKIAYALRAVSAGRFAVPPAEAEVMYDPSYWARAEGGVVEVRAPW